MDMSDPYNIPTTLRGEFLRDEPMAKHVSWRAGGIARAAYRPADVDDLCGFLRSLPASEPLLFVGLGSNLLVRDGGFVGTVVFTHHALTGIARVNGKGFHAGAGVPSPHLARFVAKQGHGEAEWLAGVPGTVGGALAMNAGCYGGETWNYVTFAETVDRSGTRRIRTRDDYEIGYRHVELKAHQDEWFVSARFAFPPGDERASMAYIRELLAKRVAAQPLNQPNAGSVFRNPPGDHAARLIESIGLKGFTVGGAQVSTRHANFIVNIGGASAADIEAVIDHVQGEVLVKTGVELVREVRIVGYEA
jgi:UDP-N-acetylmuramate dehydrogenase